MTTVIILLAACLVVPSVTIVISVATMTGAGPLIRRPQNGNALLGGLPADIRDFVGRHGMAFVDVLQYANIPFAVFRMPNETRLETYLVVMRAGGKMVCDFVSDFGPECSLTTCRHGSGFVHPRPPGAYMQAFPRATLEELLDLHLAGELFLAERGLLVAGDVEPDLAVRIERSLRRQGAYLRDYPGYWWKAPWWFWVTRHRMKNRGLAQQELPAGPARAATRA